MILGFDPGRDKCGIAVMEGDRHLHYHQVITSETALATLKTLCQQFSIELIVMGNLTTAKQWKNQITNLLPKLPLIMVDEGNSTLEARDRYWQMYPPQGLTRLLPAGMRVPPRPVDDLVAILLIERYLNCLNR